MFSFLSLGGADEIGASCFYINIDNTGILIDCGLHPQKKGIEALPKFEMLENLPLDFVFISHAHNDHIGALPFLIKKFPHLIIYSTVQTKEIADLTLHNALNIIRYEFSKDDSINIYTHDEVDLLVRSMRTIEYEEQIEIRGLRHSGTSNILVKLYNAGHILGAASILFEYNSRRIFYTGDINISSQSIMNGASIDGVRNIDLLILESTYGSTDSEKLSSWENEADRLASSINKIIDKDGAVLIPVFSLGKTQEILATIHQLMRSAKLIDTSIYTGGIGRKISRLYDLNRYLVPRNDKELELLHIPQEDFNVINDNNHFRKNNGIVIASSGMMIAGTQSYNFMKYWITQENFGIFTVGYMDPESPGYKIANTKKGSRIVFDDTNIEHKINCEIKKFYFPSHSKREDLISIVEKTNPQSVILIHGEAESKNWVGQKILQKFRHIKVYSAKLSQLIQF